MTEMTRERKRPFGLYIISGLQLIIAIFLGLGILVLDAADRFPQVLVVNPLFYSSFGWVLVGSLLLATLGLLWLKRWGWTLTMILTGAGLIFNIWQYFQGEPFYLHMVINIVIVFYLNQREVQAPFMRRNNTGSR